MKKISLFLFLIGFLFGGIAQTTSATKRQFDFRQATWGMSREEVLALEKIQPEYTETDLLVFKGECYREPCKIYYLFDQGKLRKGIYFFTKTDQGLDYFQEIAAKVDKETRTTKFQFIFSLLIANPENLEKSFNKPDGSEGSLGSYFQWGRNKVTLCFTGKKIGEKYHGKVSIEYELYEAE